jgi:ribosomal protein S18 acetylase RimI-like enzyme
MLATPETAEIIRTDSAARGKPVRVFERRLMSRAAAASLPPENHGVRNRFRFENWRDRFLPTAGAIVASAYKGEADSEINAQYSSPGDARVFLTNIVEFPGCGTFHPQASFVAFDAVTGEAAGMVLSSFVAGDTGHIAQLCVLPQARGTGLGGELMRAAVAALDERGARCVSLTVTASNRAAISLYERFSFRALRTFFAFAGTWGA